MLDDGPWTTVRPREDLTIDLMAIAEWTDLGWMDLGDVELAPGAHSLTIRVKPELNDAGKPLSLVGHRGAR